MQFPAVSSFSLFFEYIFSVKVRKRLRCDFGSFAIENTRTVNNMEEKDFMEQLAQYPIRPRAREEVRYTIMMHITLFGILVGWLKLYIQNIYVYIVVFRVLYLVCIYSVIKLNKFKWYTTIPDH